MFGFLKQQTNLGLHKGKKILDKISGNQESSSLHAISYGYDKLPHKIPKLRVVLQRLFCKAFLKNDTRNFVLQTKEYFFLLQRVLFIQQKV
jgi:hypothetical protein